MFDIGWTEILVVAIVAIVVFPSKDLPKLLRTTGQMVGRLRRMAGDFQSQFNAALREAEREADLGDTRKQIEDLKQLNPANSIRKALDPVRAAGEDIRRELTRAPAAPAATAAAAAGAEQPVAPTVDAPAPAVRPEAAPTIPAPAEPSAQPPAEAADKSPDRAPPSPEGGSR